jgi:hypothetical protein
MHLALDDKAALHITSFWQALNEISGNSDTIPTASVSPFHAEKMFGEAQRLVAVYGATIGKHTRFLSEYKANLELFDTARLTTIDLECADLLARVALPFEYIAQFEGYRQAVIRRVRIYAQAQLREMELDHAREGNPIYAWQAYTVARTYGLAVPTWVEALIDDTAENILEIGNQVAGGNALRREAECVGRALGFGNSGPGRAGWFSQAILLKRDRTMYREVELKLEAVRTRHPERRPKLTSAYQEVANEMRVDRSTVQRAYVRIMKLKSDLQ